MPHCPFCDRRHNTRRGEHVIPKWIAREFPDVKWDITNRLTKYNRKNTKYIHILTPRPCSTCNNTWMSELEKLAKPILLPLIHGTPTTLDLRDQTIIATWFVKTAMTFDLHAQKHAPRPYYFDKDELRQFKSTLAINPLYMVYLGKYTGDQFFIVQEDHSGISVARRDELQPLGDPIRVYSLTLAIKHLVIQIFCAKNSLLETVPMYIRDWSPFYVQMAAFPFSVKWPPPLSLNDALIDKFIHRWSESPPPP